MAATVIMQLYPYLHQHSHYQFPRKAHVASAACAVLRLGFLIHSLREGSPLQMAPQFLLHACLARPFSCSVLITDVAGVAVVCLLLTLQVILLMIYILHYLKDAKVWELWYITYYAGDAGFISSTLPI